MGVVTHPGYCDEELARAKTRLLESRATEREALMAMRASSAMEPISFADLQNETTASP